MNDFRQNEFTFEAVARGLTTRWHVAHRGRVVATLDLRADEWRLLGVEAPSGPLSGCSAAWSQEAAPARAKSVPAWMRREVIAQLAAWALPALCSRHVAASCDSAAAVRQLSGRLEASTEALADERSCIHAGAALSDGTYMDPGDERRIRELDEIIDASKALLARVRGKEQGATK